MEKDNKNRFLCVGGRESACFLHLLSPVSWWVLSSGMTAFKEFGRSGGNSGEANLVPLYCGPGSSHSQPHQRRHCGAGKSLSWGPSNALQDGREHSWPSPGRCPSSSLLPSCVNPKYLKTLPDVLWEAKPLLLEKRYLTEVNTVKISIEDIVCCPILWADTLDVRVCFAAILSWPGIVSSILGIWYCGRAPDSWIIFSS